MHNDHKEGKFTKMLEEQTAKIPSDVFLFAALGTIALSTGLCLAGKKHTGILVGQLAPSLLIIGLYNKLVKVEGHDQEDKGENESQ